MSRDDLALLLARIAVMAGKSVAGIFRRKVEAVWKPDASPVTNADKAAEAAIIPLLADALPGVPIVSEELVGSRVHTGDRGALRSGRSARRDARVHRGPYRGDG